jgi:hypothetical protein
MPCSQFDNRHTMRQCRGQEVNKDQHRELSSVRNQGVRKQVYIKCGHEACSKHTLWSCHLPCVHISGINSRPDMDPS